MKTLRFSLILILVITIGIGGYYFLNRPNHFTKPREFLSDDINNSKSQIPSEDGSEEEHREVEVENLSELYPDIIFRNKRTDQKVVAITYDDGPDNLYTPDILRVLKEENVKATFFITGVRAELYPDILRDIDRDGHVVASHGYAHRKFSNMTPEEIRRNLQDNQDLIYREIRKKTKLFRPPYGALDPQSIETIADEGYRIILWDVDSLDWRSLTKDEVINNVIPNVRPGSVILFHSGGDPTQNLRGTVEALPEIIRILRGEGYSFVTIPELFNL